MAQVVALGERRVEIDVEEVPGEDILVDPILVCKPRLLQAGLEGRSEGTE